MNIDQLDKALKAVCPVSGVSIGRKNNKATWRIDFMDEATDEQKKAAQDILNSMDVVEELS